MSNDFVKLKIIEKRPNKIENTLSVTFVFFERNEFDELVEQTLHIIAECPKTHISHKNT